MPLGWLLFSILFLFFALLFFIPFELKIDTERKVFYLRWTLFDLALDFSQKTTLIGIAGFRRRKKKKPVPSPSVPKVIKKKGRSWLSLLPILLQHRRIAIDLIQNGVRYAVALLRSISVSELRLDFSSENPVINGILYGAIQGIRIKKVHLSVSFWGPNRLIGEFRLPLYRTVIPTVRFLARLPYLEMVRVIRDIRRRSLIQEEEVYT